MYCLESVWIAAFGGPEWKNQFGNRIWKYVYEGDKIRYNDSGCSLLNVRKYARLQNIRFKTKLALANHSQMRFHMHGQHFSVLPS